MIAIQLLEEVLVIQNGLIHKIKEKCRSVIACDPYVVIACTDKTVKVYNKDQQLIHTLQLLKKVKRMAYYEAKHTVFIADKHGDMYALNLDHFDGPIKKETVPLSTNLAMPKSFQFFQFPIGPILILGDSYSKIKIYNADNIDEILQIHVPMEGFLKQVIRKGEILHLLYKRMDENENPFFEEYQMNENQLFIEDPELTKIFPTTPNDQQLSKKAKNIYITQNGTYLIKQDNEIIIMTQSPQGLVEEARIKGLLTGFTLTQQGYCLAVNVLQNIESQYPLAVQEIVNIQDHQINFGV